MLGKQTREAAPPSAGAMRGMVRALLVVIVTGLLAGPLGFLNVKDPGLTEAIVTLVMVLAVMPGLEAWGKFLRERGINAVFCLALVLLLGACASTETRYAAPPDGQSEAKVETYASGVSAAEMERCEKIVITQGDPVTTEKFGCVTHRSQSQGGSSLLYETLGLIPKVLLGLLPAALVAP